MLDYYSSIKIIDAYRAGSLKTPDYIAGDRFNNMIWQHLNDWLGVDQCAIVRQIGDLGQAGLSATRDGRFSAAHEAFSLGETLLSSAELDHKARLFTQACLFWPPRAYLSYKEKRTQLALDLLTKAYETDLLLEDDGFSILLMHRVQLLNNYMRMEAGSGSRLTALILGHQVLDYLESKTAATLAELPPPWSLGWRDIHDFGESGLVADMHNQIGTEHATLLRSVPSSHPTRTAYYSWKPFALVPATQANLWRAYDAARSGGSVSLCVNAAVALLRRGPLPSEALWQSAASELAALIGGT